MIDWKLSTAEPGGEPMGFRFLLVSLLLLFVIVPFFEIAILGNVVTTLILFLGLYAIAFDKRVFRICILLAAIGLVANWTSHWVESKGLVVAGAIFGLAFFAVVAAAMLARVVGGRRVTAETIAGAICVYLLIGVIWGNVFFILESFAPGSFSGGPAQAAELGAAAAARGQISHFAYYSFVTLSTLGYGEVTPITPPARSLAALEAIVGQLYLAILIARLVSQHLSYSSGAVPASVDAAGR